MFEHVVLTDSAAARGAIQGSTSMRYLLKNQRVRVGWLRDYFGFGCDDPGELTEPPIAGVLLPVASGDNLADIFTKPLLIAKQQQFAHSLGCIHQSALLEDTSRCTIGWQIAAGVTV